MRVAVLLLTLATVCPAPLRAQLSLDVNQALSRAVTRLLEVQRANGSFARLGSKPGAAASYPIGATALVTYALRKAGLQPGHPALVSAARYLLEQPLKKTYSVSALVMALHALGQPEYEARLLEAAAWLLEMQHEGTGLWAYPEHQPDLSNTQFAALALQAAARHGHETPPQVWADVIEGTLRHQRADGGFFYRTNTMPEVSGTMTTAGLTTLYIALSALEQAGKKAPQQKLAREAIERGWIWLDDRFSARGGPMGHAGEIEDRYPYFGRNDFYHYYYLYGIERVATFADRNTVGGLAWYPALATEILSHETAKGGWETLENTCFAMLVLRRATISGRHESSPRWAAQEGNTESDLGTQGGAAGRAPGPGEASRGEVALWAYTTDRPKKKWMRPDFNDSSWARGEGGFSGGGAIGLVKRTRWDSSDLWVRRPFTWGGVRDDLRLYVIHDDAVEIWINGVLAASGKAWSGHRYKTYTISKAARQSLREGENTIAAWVHDLGGGRSLDIRFTPPVDDQDRPDFWSRSLPWPDVPFIRRWSLLGPLENEGHEVLLEQTMPTAVASGRAMSNRTWKTQRTYGSQLVVSDVLGGKSGTASYVSVWLHAEAPRDAFLWLGVSDGVRGWIDDEPLLLHHEHGAAHPDALRVPLALKAGARRLVLLLEQEGGACSLFARVAGVHGEPVDDLRYALSDEAPDDTQIALAQPDLFDLATLARRLPVASAKSLHFDRKADLEGVAFSGIRAAEPRWIVKTSAKLPAPQPATATRGVIRLWPPSTDRPARLLARVQIGARARTLSAVVALAEGATLGGQLSMTLYDGMIQHLLAADVLPVDGKGRHDFRRLTTDLGEYAGKDALLILEWSALPGAEPQPLFVDELSLR